MGLDMKALAEMKDRMATKDTDKRPHICACGHPVNKHEAQLVTTGKSKCYALHSNCMCTELVPVLKCPNARLFSYKSDETGHALMKGILKTMDGASAGRLEWLVDLRCMTCGTEEGVLAITQDEGRTTQLLCEEHR